MAVKVDTEILKNEVDIQEIISRYIYLQKDGIHYMGACPFHNEDTPSFVVTPNKRMYYCFGCGAGGDVIQFLMDYNNWDFKTAVAELQGFNPIDKPAVTKSGTYQPTNKPVEWSQVKPKSPATAETLQKKFRKIDSELVQLQYVAHWAYHDADGGLLGYAVRFAMPDGSKDVYPLTYRTNGKRSEWRWQGFDKPRPLYNLHLLKKYPDATVLLVEGEKTADAAQRQLNPEKTVVVTWPGGSNGIEHVDWTPLDGRTVIRWPDNDVVGIAAMLHIGLYVPGASILPLNATLPKGWDAADKDWKPNELREYVLSKVIDDILPNNGDLWRFVEVDKSVAYTFGIKDGKWKIEKGEANPETKAEPPAKKKDKRKTKAPAAPPQDYPPAEPPSRPLVLNDRSHEQYFRFLGFEKTENGSQAYYFLAKGSNQVVRLPASSISTNTLLQIAPLSYWQDRYYGKRPFDATAALNWIVQASSSIGPFREKNVRGRGAWIDDGRVVMHVGDKLFVNGQPFGFNDVKTKYVYEVDEELGYKAVKPLNKDDAEKLLHWVKRLEWERAINPYLLIGWCVIAPVCGALNWRPHLWVTGPAGTGKSWLFRNVVGRLLGGTAVRVQGSTSEAGLRQTIKSDALPVVFDEAEGEDKKSHERMQEVLSLMRSSSSEDGGMLVKGSSFGRATTFRIRSCFAFASIAIQVKQQSDRTRIAILGLKQNKDANAKQQWYEIEKDYWNLVNDDFVARLQTRTLKNLPTILKNIQTFSNAAAFLLGSQRTGDQLGALIAGAYSLISDSTVSFEAALKWLEKFDWAEEKGLNTTVDERALLDYLMGRITTVDTNHGRFERTIGELVAICVGRHKEELINDGDADARLRRLGFKVRDQQLLVSNTAEWIVNSLRDTAWPQNHNKILQRLQGATTTTATRFSAANEARAVAIPLSVVFADSEPKKFEGLPFEAQELN